MDKQDHVKHLFSKYLDNDCTEVEIRRLLDYFKLEENERTLRAFISEALSNEYESNEEHEQALDEITGEVYKSVLKRIHKKPSVAINRWLPAAAVVAACLFVVVTGVLYYKTELFGKQRSISYSQHPDDTTAIDSRAVLILADGKKIVLENAGKGFLAEQPGIEINKIIEGKINYHVISHPEKKSNPVFNTVTTPRGGQYQVTLPDGSNVWLNAASSLRFPTIFNLNERKVEISGEAYFEVAKNKELPFRVVSGAQTIEVLGTHFNVNAYPDEDNIKTTLLEGSVKVSSGNSSNLISPGEQALINRKNNNTIQVIDADTASATAWKKGYFRFDDTDLFSLMRQLSRWYDMDIVYEGNITNEAFVGLIDRKASLSNILKILELGGVHFRIENKKIILLP